MSTAKSPATEEALTAELHEIEVELNQLGLERLVFFSDAVYAIAITLLVIDLRLPPGAGQLDNAGLARALLSMVPQFFSFVLSFLVIGLFWNMHHRKFRYVQGYDRRLIFINLLLLMAVAFLPFPTAVLGESGNATATILYAGTLVAAGLWSILLWWYPMTHGLLRAGTPPRTKRLEMVRPVLLTLVFGLSIPIALYNPDWAKYFWAVLIPISIFVR